MGGLLPGLCERPRSDLHLLPEVRLPDQGLHHRAGSSQPDESSPSTIFRLSDQLPVLWIIQRIFFLLGDAVRLVCVCVFLNHRCVDKWERGADRLIYSVLSRGRFREA